MGDNPPLGGAAPDRAGALRQNVNRIVVRRMLQAHVYGDASFITDRLLDEKTAVTSLLLR